MRCKMRKLKIKKVGIRMLKLKGSISLIQIIMLFFKVKPRNSKILLIRQKIRKPQDYHQNKSSHQKVLSRGQTLIQISKMKTEIRLIKKKTKTRKT